MPDLSWFFNLLTSAEWGGLLWIIVTIYAGTEIAKRIYRQISKRFRSTDIWFISTGIGASTSLLVWPHESHVPWFVVGIVAGPLASAIHKNCMAVIRWRWPGLAAALTGDRRRTNSRPPEGDERREP